MPINALIPMAAALRSQAGSSLCAAVLGILFKTLAKRDGHGSRWPPLRPPQGVLQRVPGAC